MALRLTPGLERALIAEIRKTLNRVLEFPGSGSPLEDGVRRLLFPAFRSRWYTGSTPEVSR
jgi:hypothetical protein